MELYDTYESEQERENAIALESAEIALERSLLAYQAITESAELNLREAELRCVMESGDACTLMDYYEDAVQQTEEKKKGIIASIWDKILSLIEKIKKALGLGKKDDAEKYAVSSNAPKAVQALKSAGNAIKDVATKGWRAVSKAIKEMNNALKVLIISAVVLVGGHFVIKKVKGKGGSGEAEGNTGETVAEISGAEVNADMNFLQKILDQIQVVAQKFKRGGDKGSNGADSNDSGEAGGIFSKITSKIHELITHFKNSKPVKFAKKVLKSGKNGSNENQDSGDNGGSTKDDGGSKGGNDSFSSTEDYTSYADSAEDFDMTKDFAELLADESYEESADADDLFDLLAPVI
jgi:hypothetical protein